MKNYTDNEKCVFNDSIYCIEIDKCENCEHFPEKYRNKLNSLYGVQSTGQNEQLSMFNIIIVECDYGKKRFEEHRKRTKRH